MGHLAANFSKVRVQREASWWKDSEKQHYTVVKNVEGGEKQKSFSQIVSESPQMISPATTNVPPNKNVSTKGGKGLQQAFGGTETPEGQEKKYYEKVAAQETLLRKDKEGVSHLRWSWHGR